MGITASASIGTEAGDGSDMARGEGWGVDVERSAGGVSLR
jgi:hypothetical protein